MLLSLSHNDEMSAERRGGPASPASRGLAYVPALDGVRALAIVLVLFYHGGWSWAQGGFIGVDVFFVLSGFLITTLLVHEFRGSGRIALARFWRRRALRLFPALLATLMLVGAYAAFVASSDTLGSLRADMLATLFYFANWRQVLGGHGYFAQIGMPSPLLHTWSLAIEEQFYVVWPLVVLAVLRFTRSLRALLVLALLGGGASAAAMAWLYAGGSGTSRVYFGTDTRAQDLLVGAALAVVMALWAPGGIGPRRGAGDRSDGTARARGILSIGGVASLVFLCGITVRATGGTAWLYEGGFAVAALASAGLVAAAVLLPSSAVARALSLPPVRYVGRISYGLYLWHWPLFLILDRERTGLRGTDLFVLRVVIAIAAAAASYHLLEMPIRRGGLLRGWRGWIAAPVTVGATSVVLLASTAGAAVGSPAAALSSAPGAPAAVLLHGGDVQPGIGPSVPPAPPGPGGPARILLVGDSLAATLSLGYLGSFNARFGVNTVMDTVLGCGLVTGGDVGDVGQIMREDIGIRNTGLVECSTWPQRWQADVQKFRPDVVLVVDGPWEVRDRKLDGHWTHLGQPQYDHLEFAALQQAVASLGSAGAKVEFLTSPYFSQPEQANGQAWPADDPRRVDRYNQLLRQVAAADPRRAGVLDMGAVVSPGHFAKTVHGVSVRWWDGVHLSVAGAQMVWTALMPSVAALALTHHRGR